MKMLTIIATFELLDRRSMTECHKHIYSFILIQHRTIQVLQVLCYVVLLLTFSSYHVTE